MPNRLFRSVVLAGALALGSNLAIATETVTVDNFVRAETDLTLKRYVAQGGFGTIAHLRQPTPIDQQNVIRMNRDTLYSFGVFDLTKPVTITKPPTGGRFQSMLIVNQDHSIWPAVHDAGKFTLTRKMIGTRYVFVIFRTFMDPSNPADLKAANTLQDKITAVQAHAGSFQIPDWDEASLHKVRDAINVLASTKTDASTMFGQPEVQIEPDRSYAGRGLRMGRQSKICGNLSERCAEGERWQGAVCVDGEERACEWLLVHHRLQ